MDHDILSDMDTQTIINVAKPILEKHHVKKAALFGSIVRGRTGDKSDIDMLIEPPENYNLFDLADIKVELEDALHREVDLVKYDSIRPALREAILKYEHPIL